MRDLQKYPAAARAVLSAREILEVKLANRFGGRRKYSPAWEAALNWRAMLTRRGKSYRVLNITLDAVQSGPTNFLLKYLPVLNLQQEVLSPGVLYFPLLWIHVIVTRETQGRIKVPLPIVLKRIENSLLLRSGRLHSLEEIFEAFKLYSVSRGLEIPDRKVEDLIAARDDTFMGMLHLFGHLRKTVPTSLSSCVRLAQKQREHQTRLRHRGQRPEPKENCGDLGRELPEPPFHVPDFSGLKFLSRLEDYFKEAAVMQHCIDRYAGEALKGKVYTFHLDFAGHAATIAFNGYGEMLEVQGPRNSQNAATHAAGLIFWKR